MLLFKNCIRYIDGEDPYRQIRAGSQELGKVEEMGKSGLANFSEILKDIFMALFLKEPCFYPEEKLAASTLVNRFVIQNLLDSRSYRQVKRYTAGNQYGAAMATVSYGREIITGLNENIKKAANRVVACEKSLYRCRLKSKTYQTILDYLEGYRYEKLTIQFGTVLAGLKIIAERKDKELATLTGELKELLAGEANSGIPVNYSLDKVQKKLVEVHKAMDYLSKCGGAVKNKASGGYKQVKDFIDSPKLQRIVRRLGRLKESLVDMGNHNIPALAGIEYGRNIARTAPDELLDAFVPARKKLFQYRYMEESLTQYCEEIKNKDKGSLIICLDNSGSMQGPKEESAKSLALALLELSARDKRDAIAIMFGGSTEEARIFQFPAGKNNSLEVMDFAGYFMCSRGTDFERPLAEALQHLHKSRHRNSDIIFITDGVCSLSDQFLRGFLEQKKARGFRVISVIVHYGYVDTGGVEAFSDEVYHSKDLKGHDVAGELFGAFQK